MKFIPFLDFAAVDDISEDGGCQNQVLGGDQTWTSWPAWSGSSDETASLAFENFDFAKSFSSEAISASSASSSGVSESVVRIVSRDSMLSVARLRGFEGSELQVSLECGPFVGLDCHFFLILPTLG
jgi:hypothetical protein